MIANELPAVLRAALVKQLEDLSYAYGRTAARDAHTATGAIEELLTLHPNAEAYRTSLAWWLRQFDAMTVEPCFCLYDAVTGERADNPHCPRHHDGPTVADVLPTRGAE